MAGWSSRVRTSRSTVPMCRRPTWCCAAAATWMLWRSSRRARTRRPRPANALSIRCAVRISSACPASAATALTSCPRFRRRSSAIGPWTGSRRAFASCSGATARARSTSPGLSSRSRACARPAPPGSSGTPSATPSACCTTGTRMHRVSSTRSAHRAASTSASSRATRTCLMMRGRPTRCIAT